MSRRAVRAVGVGLARGLRLYRSRPGCPGGRRPRRPEPGDTLWLGLRQRIAPGWHTYWINPGDSGEPLAITWSLPEGFVAGDLVWPGPERIRVGPVTSYGYSGEVVLLVPVTAPRTLAPGGQAP